MRTVAMPRGTTGTLLCEWLCVGGKPSARWRYASRPNALRAATSGALPGLTDDTRCNVCRVLSGEPERYQRRGGDYLPCSDRVRLLPTGTA
jgi:hypothetical protein